MKLVTFFTILIAPNHTVNMGRYVIKCLHNSIIDHLLGPCRSGGVRKLKSNRRSIMLKTTTMNSYCKSPNNQVTGATLASDKNNLYHRIRLSKVLKLTDANELQEATPSPTTESGQSILANQLALPVITLDKIRYQE